MTELQLDPSSTALVLIDVQGGIAAGDTKPHSTEVLHTHPVTHFFPTIGRVRTTRDVIGALG